MGQTCVGTNREERDHTRTRTNQIYEMTDEVCMLLRQERNERLADFDSKVRRRKWGQENESKTTVT